MDAKAAARETVEAARANLVALSHRIHAHPELAFQEERACGWLAEMLDAAGFRVQTGICDLPTAFEARAGSGPLEIVICAEYDALPGIGHACGHNIIAAAAAGAGIAAARVADEVGLTIRVIGTPAEENGGGKVLLLDRGAFAGAHAAMMVHPAPGDLIAPPFVAASVFDVRYAGKEAHASAFPELGINAADALTVAQVAIGLLRQHLRPSDRIHGIITKGGDAPNIVPADTAARFIVRAKTIEELDDVRAKTMRCFEAGAVATGARLTVDPAFPAYAEIRHDPDLGALYRASAEALGRAFPDYPPGSREILAASTDMGNVSRAIPSIHPQIGLRSLPAVNHQPEFTAYCATPDADRAVFDGALAMAWTAIDAAQNATLRDRLLSRAASA